MPFAPKKFTLSLNFTLPNFLFKHKISLKFVILFVSVMILDEKIEPFSMFFKFVINELSLRRTSITWTDHFAIPSLLECFVSSKRPLFFDPEIFCRTHHLAKLINNLKNNFVIIPTCSEFRTKIARKFLFIFPCSSEPLIMAFDYESPYCYLSFFYFIHNSRSFPSNKI